MTPTLQGHAGGNAAQVAGICCHVVTLGNPDAREHPTPQDEHMRPGMAGQASVIRTVLDTWTTTSRGVVVHDVGLVWDADEA